ncbi:MAG: DASS family sodium-coupled anion symporter, partial [Methanobacterium sp.]|uniref:DASS family sodium-coupled anion symporter n=1 Tax=Methanobacterium sp. TaxID=2164 RepID=UPI003C76E64A
MPGLAHSGHSAIALLVFAIIMWASEAQVLAVTSLMLMFLQPILGIDSFSAAAVGFANPIIFLMIGGFILAVAIGKSGLAKRFTYWMLQKVGTSPSMSIFAAVFSTGLLSAWIENVVAFAMLLPIIKTIVPLFGINDAEKGNSNFAKAMVLGASYGSLAGGFGTEIGTAPNLMAAAYTHLPFVNWMVFGFPLAIIMLFVTWQLLGRIFPPEVDGVVGGHETLTNAMSVMGSITRTEKITAAILFFTIGLWVTTGITGLDSYSVALIGASLYFVTGVIDWKDA